MVERQRLRKGDQVAFWTPVLSGLYPGQGIVVRGATHDGIVLVRFPGERRGHMTLASQLRQIDSSREA